MKIELDNNNIKYSGRIDFSNPKKPQFIFPSSSLEIHFIGSGMEIEVTNKHDYFRSFIGAVIDGTVNKFEINMQGKTKISIFNEEKEEEHTVIIYKALDACHEFTINKMKILGNVKLLQTKDKPKRKIEFYGDSISAGEITEAIEYVGKEDPIHEGQYSNSWYSYTWMCARKLNAEIHNISQGGIALTNNAGWYQEPDYMGMEEMWDSLHYSPKFGAKTKWDFSLFTPDVVVIAIGQNDSHPDDYMATDYYCEKSIYWRKQYKEFVMKIKEKYKNAYIILTTTPMFHNEKWDQSINDVCIDIGNEKIKHFLYKNNGIGTPGHLRISESEEMATELAAYIERTCY